MIILYPICAPIAWALDKVLGRELLTIYSRKELLSIIEEHEDSKESDIDHDEKRIAIGALTFSNKTVAEVMTPIKVATMLPHDTKLTPAVLKKLRAAGHSRVPLYKSGSSEIVGLLYIKRLVGIKTHNKKALSVAEKKVYEVGSETTLDTVLNKFLKTRHHLFVVEDDFGAPVGIITIEDIVEEIVGKEIVDEDDKHADMRRVARSKSRKK